MIKILEFSYPWGRFCGLTALIVFISISFGFAQRSAITTISGTVMSANDRSPIPYASISIVERESDGTVADSTGAFLIRTVRHSGTLQITAVGYGKATFNYTAGANQDLMILLQPEASDLGEVVVKIKKPRYKNRNNPAVAFIKQVIEHKKDNDSRITGNYSYKLYEKLNLSLNLSNDSLSASKHWILQKFPFLQVLIDSSENAKRTLIPIYLVEKSSNNQIFNGKQRDPVLTGLNQSRIDQYLDEDGFDEFLDQIYGEPNIYDHDIAIGKRRLMSPLADSAPLFYEYYLQDTIKTTRPWQLKVMVKPKNDQDALLSGYIYVGLDEKYAPLRAELTVSNHVNINWIDNISINVSYTAGRDQKYYVKSSFMALNLGVLKNGINLFGRKTLVLSDFKDIKEEVAGQAHERTNKVAQLGNVERPGDLEHADHAALKNIDGLKASRSFRRSMSIGSFLLSGYATAGPIDIGPIGTFLSFNPVEGPRIKLGARTNESLSKTIVLDGYVAYGFRDDALKYGLGSTFSLNKSSIYQFPVHTFSARYSQDIQVPGQDLLFTGRDNFLMSFRRGDNNKMWYIRKLQLEYFRENLGHLSMKIGINNSQLAGVGSLLFEPNTNTDQRSNLRIVTSEMYGELRWAPHETFFQGKRFRRPIDKGYPVFTLQSAISVKGLAASQYDYIRIAAQAKKRFFLSQLGQLEFLTEAGALFGKVPYPLLLIHRANQTYAYQDASFNLMNYLEFVSDRYATGSLQHHFMGFFLNKIPLLKKLKLREIVSVKALWGSLTNKNDPALSDGLFKMPTHPNGALLTHRLDRKPYIEGGVGLSNIFKVLRVDLIYRFTYKENQSVSPWGIRAKLNIVF